LLSVAVVDVTCAGKSLATEDWEVLSLHLVISKGPNERGWDWGGGVELAAGLPRIGGDVTLVV